jgi:hypothetical protein
LEALEYHLRRRILDVVRLLGENTVEAPAQVAAAAALVKLPVHVDVDVAMITHKKLLWVRVIVYRPLILTCHRRRRVNVNQRIKVQSTELRI